MPIFENQSRDALRRVYIDAWRKRQQGAVMEPLEAQVAEVIALHPEYHRAIEQTEHPLDRDYSPEGGETNPFLHMGLHLAVRDQIATDRPPGVREIFTALERRLGSSHEAEHRLIDTLAEALWTAQRNGTAPDEAAYLESLRRLL